MLYIYFLCMIRLKFKRLRVSSVFYKMNMSNAECVILKGNNFKMWKKLLLNILKANDFSEYITINIFNQYPNELNFNIID